jgi:hypothetical protein
MVGVISLGVTDMMKLNTDIMISECDNGFRHSKATMICGLSVTE